MQCKATTVKGKRCKHPAIFGGYCIRHVALRNENKKAKNATNKRN